MRQPLFVCSEDGINGSRNEDGKSAHSEGPLLVVEQIRRMRGGSQSHLMRCRGENYYVVKFQGNPQGTRILVNDLLGTLLASWMGLPTTPVAVCSVTGDLIRLTPDLCFQIPGGRIPCQPGLHFGSRYVGNPHNVKVRDFLSDDCELAAVKNVADFAGMLVFDKWTCNTDGRQTLFAQTGDGYKTVMIDQGMCFNGLEWNFPDAPLRGLYDRRAVYDSVRGLDDFEPWLTVLENEINERVIVELAKNVPPEWYESNWNSLQGLLEWLDRRRNRVRELLWNTWKCTHFRGVFPNWNLTLALGETASSGGEVDASAP